MKDEEIVIQYKRKKPLSFSGRQVTKNSWFGKKIRPDFRLLEPKNPKI